MFKFGNIENPRFNMGECSKKTKRIAKRKKKERKESKHKNEK
jgi:hypothetical protein